MRFINGDSQLNTDSLLGCNMFAYCSNNAISISRTESLTNTVQSQASSGIDISSKAVLYSIIKSSKAVHYLRFLSADDAAKAFAQETYAATSYTLHEFGTVIYSITYNGKTTYDYTTPISGNPHSINLNNITVPSGAKIVAYAHTHPNGNSFSKADITHSHAKGKTTYVACPSLNLLKYTPWQSDLGEQFVGEFKPVGLSYYDKIDYILRFYGPWLEHIDGCEYSQLCGERQWPNH